MKVLHAGAIYAAGNIVSVAAPFALLPLLTRVLTPAEYGHVVAFSLMTMFCTPFAGLSVHGAVGIAWFNRPRTGLPAFVGAAFAVVAASTVLTAIVASALLAIFPLLVADLSPVWAALAALTAGANIAVQCRLALWQSQLKPVANAVLQFTASAFNVGLSLVGVLILRMGDAGRNGGIVLSACVAALAASALLVSSREVEWRLRREDVKALISFGVPLIPHVLGGVLIVTLDRWFVSAQLGPEALGVYGAGAQLGMVMAILADAFVKAYNPWLNARLASNESDDKYCVVGAIYIAVPAFLCAAAIVGFGLHLTSSLLLGAQYSAATILLPWFMLGGAFTGIYYCTTNLFFFSRQTSLLAMTTSVSALIGSGLIWILVSMYGVQGAAMGYAATQGVLALLVNIVASRNFDFPWGEVNQVINVWWRKVFKPALH